jgi:hypothetical protein
MDRTGGMGADLESEPSPDDPLHDPGLREPRLGLARTALGIRTTRSLRRLQSSTTTARASGFRATMSAVSLAGYSPIRRPMISFMISDVPPPMGPRRASRSARSTSYSRM